MTFKSYPSPVDGAAEFDLDWFTPQGSRPVCMRPFGHDGECANHCTIVFEETNTTLETRTISRTIHLCGKGIAT